MASADPTTPLEFAHSDESETTLRPLPAFRSWRTLCSNWVVELGSTLLGALCVAALAIILAHYDHRSPPLFGSHASTQLTLNTVIAIVTTAAKAFLILPLIECISQQKWMYFARKHRKLSRFATFDKATKGIVGACKLLWETGAKNVAAISPAVMLLGFTLEPFSQQLISTTTIRRVPVANGGNGGYLGAVTNWDGGNGFPQNILGVGYLVSPGMADAIWSGLSSTNKGLASDLRYSCPTGDCTYEYETLGVCAQAVDVSDKLVPNALGGNLTNWCTSDGSCLDVQGCTNSNCGSSPTGFGSKYLQIIPALPSHNLTTQTPTLLYYNESIAFSNIPSPLLDAYVIVQNATGCDGIPGPWCWQGAGWRYSVWEFALEWCVQNSSTTISNGTPVTRQLSSYSNFSTPGTDQNLTTSTGFSVNYDAHAGLQDYLASLFNGTAAEIAGNQESQWSVSSNLVQAIISSWDWDLAWTITDPGATGFGLLLQNLTLSMTKYMQNTAASTNQIVLGQMYHDIDVVNVRWRWITGLAIFTGLITIFVIATVVEQCFGLLRGGQAWKSSPLAMLHALDPRLHSQLSGITELSSMTTQDDQHLVRLCPVPGEGWRLQPSSGKS